MTRGVADLLLLLTAMIWGAAFIGQATAMAHMGPLTFTGVRFLLSALVVLPFVFMETGRRGRVPRNLWPMLLALGGAFFLGAGLQQIGLGSTSVTNTGFLTALYVIMVPLLSAVFLRQPIHWAVWPAALLSLVGTFLIGGGTLAGLSTGDLFVIASAVFWAAQIILMGILAGRDDRPLFAAFAQYLIAGLLGLVIGLMLETPPTGSLLTGIAAAWKELLYTGIVSGGIAFTLQAIAQSHTPASDAAIIISTEGLFAAFFAALLLKEQPPLLTFIGAGAVLVAVLITQLVPLFAGRKD